MIRHDIPTARFLTVSEGTVEQGDAFIGSLPSPYVLKADEAAAGRACTSWKREAGAFRAKYLAVNLVMPVAG